MIDKVHFETYTTYGWDGLFVAHLLRQEPVSYLPGKNRGAFPLILCHSDHHVIRGHPRLTATYSPRSDGACLVVSRENLGDAAVGDLQDPGDVAGTGAAVGKLDDPLARRVREGAAVDENPSELVDAAVTCQSKQSHRLCKSKFLLTLGIVSWLHTHSASSRSRISQANMLGHSRLNWATFTTTSAVATLGLLPPMALGLMEPVS